jgi:hypothetical protein
MLCLSIKVVATENPQSYNPASQASPVSPNCLTTVSILSTSKLLIEKIYTGISSTTFLFGKSLYQPRVKAYFLQLTYKFLRVYGFLVGVWF